MFVTPRPLYQAKELSESNMKIGLLEKKVDSIDVEISRQVGLEKEETKKLQELLGKQNE